MGKITVSRRTYRGDWSAGSSLAPLDIACGMSGRFMTPDVEEMAAHAAAMVTPREMHQLLTKSLPEAPSTTAIQNAARRIGATIAEHRESIEKVIDDEQPLTDDGDMLVTGWDGVMAPTRERERPQDRRMNRMRYARFIASGFPIGSGPVEAAAKNIVQARLQRSGMRWSRAGSQHVLNLRAHVKSQRWESMWKVVVEAA